uniref:C3H1-type domain-containing protein n=1 Tax=Neobodo designis TaxID=312471 RepID=A0A7S1MC12_NEODS|mmetsp:Transcript_37719/g.116558  ORF Transcript_37719/g.116558 Transcript_37719/m.116558 type:complete len:494 (+) Transcript_37719:218-1699(+)
MDVATTCAVAAQPCGTLLPDGLFSEALGNERGAGFDFTLPKAESSSDSTGLIDSSGSNSDSGAAPSATSGSSGFKAPPVRPKAPQPNVTAPVLETLLAASPDAMCPAGATIGVYNSDMTQHYAIPSEHVQITRGAIKYVDHHARYGAQTRFRFQLCHNFLLRKCPKLSECSYIHATQLPAPTQVHLNPFAPRRSSSNRQVPSATHDDPSVADTYPTFESGYFVPLFPPSRPRDPSGAQLDPVSSNAAVVVVPSEKLIVTEGAKELLLMLPALPPRQLSALRTAPEAVAAVMHELPHPVVHKARHCAHYQFKRLCNLGGDCHFIHSKVPFADNAPPQPTFSNNPNRAPRRTGAKPIPAEAFAPGAAPRSQSDSNVPLTVSAPQPHPGNAMAPRAATESPGAGMPPSPDGMSFLAGMQYAMQMLQMQQGMGMQLHGPAAVPVASPPSIGVSPFAAGIGAGHAAATNSPGSTASVFGAQQGAPMAGPLAHIPAQQQ